MEENSLTLAILREIRDNTAATSTEVARLNLRVDHLTERVDHLTERVDHLTERVDQVVQEQIRQGTTMIEILRVQGKLVDAVVALDQRQIVLERAVGQVVTELKQVNDRLDHVLTGPLGSFVRAHDRRLDDLEHRVDAIERRAG
jgi:predicted nuclease with TOPRIM domain